MTTFGHTSPTFNTWYQNTGSNNQVGTLCAATQDGVIDSLSVYVAGNGAGGADITFCIWDSSGNLLGQCATFFSSGGSASAGGQGWTTAALLTPVTVTNGTSYYLGFYRAPSDTVDYSTQSGTGTTHKQGSNISAPGKLATNATTEILGAYATYAVGGAHVTQGDASEPLRYAYVTQGDTTKPQRQILVKNSDGTYHAAT